MGIGWMGKLVVVTALSCLWCYHWNVDAVAATIFLLFLHSSSSILSQPSRTELEFFDATSLLILHLILLLITPSFLSPSFPKEGGNEHYAFTIRYSRLITYEQNTFQIRFADTPYSTHFFLLSFRECVRALCSFPFIVCRVCDDFSSLLLLDAGCW